MVLIQGRLGLVWSFTGRWGILLLALEVNFAVVADAANSSLDGKLNLLGAFDRIMVGSVPALHAGSVVVARVAFQSVEAGFHAVKFVLLDPDGRELWAVAGELRIPQHASLVEGYQDLIIPVTGWPLPTVGAYCVKILIDGHVAKDIKVDVKLSEEVADDEQGGKASE